MKTIWKFKLEPELQQSIKMPKEHKVLSVGVTQGDLCLWALVDAETEEYVYRTFYIVLTGQDVPDEDVYFSGTIVLEDFVFHVYSLKGWDHGD